MTGQARAQRLSELLLGVRRSNAALQSYVQGLSVGRKAALGTGGLVVLVAIVGMLSPPRGRIVPVGPNVVEAYRMLVSTPSGRALVSEVCKATEGDIIYVTLGATERDRLSDHTGRPARGVTRATTRWNGRRFWAHTATVIVNEDCTGGKPGEIVKSLAFELENVLHVYRHPAADGGIDSPDARLTQARILQELGGRR